VSAIQAKVVMYATAICPFCIRAEQLLRDRGVSDIVKLPVDSDPELLEEMIQRTERRTVPQIFIGETYVGGYDDLFALDQQGQLLPMLA